MRDAENAAFARGVSAERLMNQAGSGIAETVQRFFPRPGYCLIFSGKGNNGGDALVAAAHLKRAGLVEARRDGKWMHYRWAQHGDPLVRHVLTGLREWMAKDDRMNGERSRRSKICCRVSRRKPNRIKTK